MALLNNGGAAFTYLLDGQADADAPSPAEHPPAAQRPLGRQSVRSTAQFIGAERALDRYAQEAYELYHDIRRKLDFDVRAGGFFGVIVGQRNLPKEIHLAHLRDSADELLAEASNTFLFVYNVADLFKSPKALRRKLQMLEHMPDEYRSEPFELARRSLLELAQQSAVLEEEDLLQQLLETEQQVRAAMARLGDLAKIADVIAARVGYLEEGGDPDDIQDALNEELARQLEKIGAGADPAVAREIYEKVVPYLASERHRERLDLALKLVEDLEELDDAETEPLCQEMLRRNPEDDAGDDSRLAQALADLQLDAATQLRILVAAYVNVKEGASFYKSTASMHFPRGARGGLAWLLRHQGTDMIQARRDHFFADESGGAAYEEFLAKWRQHWQVFHATLDERSQDSQEQLFQSVLEEMQAYYHQYMSALEELREIVARYRALMEGDEDQDRLAEDRNEDPETYRDEDGELERLDEDTRLEQLDEDANLEDHRGLPDLEELNQ